MAKRTRPELPAARKAASKAASPAPARKPSRVVSPPKPAPKKELLPIDRQALLGLIRTLERGGVADFEYEDANVRIRIARGPSGYVGQGQAMAFASPSGTGAAVAVTASAPIVEVADDGIYVTSPFVGTFYRSPSPESAAFVEVGSTVKKGQALCIVEAMKLMNEIEADVAGTIAEILVENGKSVEFGQRLFRVKP
jgi:acetyl-CoA carboxylase biotin carboxyl carrier protein